MMLLWIAIAVLLLPALWLLAAPLRQAHQLREQQASFEAHDGAAVQNVAIFKRRLASLEAARERGDIDMARFDEDRLELERSLLDDTASQSQRPLKAALSGRLAVPLAMLVLVGGVLAWYQHNGAEGDLSLYALQQELKKDPDNTLADYVESMEAEAARQPDNANVWGALFPLYRAANQPQKAADALERLMTLEGRVPPLLAQLAQLRFFMAEREMTPEVASLIDETLALDPREPTVLGIQGIHAFDLGDYATAIDRWRRALATAQDEQTADSLREGIAAAQSRLGQSPASPGQGAESSRGIRVSVTLDPALAGRLDDSATLFVTARDVAGERPPLAVLRARVADLPMTVVLDDSTAMSPQAQLSQVREARVVARVSQSGQAAPQAGDLFSDYQTVDVTPVDDRETAELVINHVFE